MLIMSNYAELMSLTSLRIIRGRTLFFPSPDDHTGYSLFVSHNYKPGSLSVGLTELQLVSLHGQSQSVSSGPAVSRVKNKKAQLTQRERATAVHV